MNYEYRKNLMQLKNFVLVMFENDSMMIPKESAWFGFYSPGQNENITKMEDSVLYQVVFIINTSQILIFHIIDSSLHSFKKFSFTGQDRIKTT